MAARPQAASAHQHLTGTSPLPPRAVDFVRQPWVEPTDWEGFKAALVQVHGLTVRATHGIVTFSGAGFSSRYSCRNPELMRLVAKVLATVPKSLDEFMELL